MRDRNAGYRDDPGRQEMQRQYRAENRERLNARQRERRSTPEGREKHLNDQRERRQREKRRRELGLPPRPRHRATINERARNEAAATAFFTRKRTAPEIKRLRFEEMVPGTINAASRAADLAARRETSLGTLALGTRQRMIENFLHSEDGRILHEEVRMDSIARQLRGLDPYPDLDRETRRRATLSLVAGSRPDRPERQPHGHQEEPRRRAQPINAARQRRRATPLASQPSPMRRSL